MTDLEDKLRRLASHLHNMDSESGDAKLLWNAAEEISRLTAMVAWMDEKPECRAAMYQALQERVSDAETSLKIFDPSASSEYWSRHEAGNF